MKTPLLVLALCLAAAPAFAQAPLEGGTIVAVHVTGLDHIKESVVLEQIVSVPGQPYHRVTADRDIVRLDRLGVFGAISVTAVAVNDGVRVDVMLTETPRMVPAIAVASASAFTRKPAASCSPTRTARATCSPRCCSRATRPARSSRRATGCSTVAGGGRGGCV